MITEEESNALDRVRKMIINPDLKEEDRLAIIEALTTGICRHCGVIITNYCHCTNDE